ncbi:hypothetical protein DSI80_11385 [Mycobacterium tuberculosis]|nr:hypothetical protein DSI80_11385 [Mycobacterium tuberculosis]REX84132.1 hypothetical protein DSL05_24385 [Mycobacterium tuberculosis]
METAVIDPYRLHTPRSRSTTSGVSGARFTSAAPPHRFALHRRRRGSRAPLLLIASLCIVVGAAHVESA